MTPPDFVIVLTTLPPGAELRKFAGTLVEERLAACVNVGADMQSTYWWNGEVQHEVERQIVIKTTHHRVDALLSRIKELHPYEVPELLVIPIAGGSEAYLRWVRESTSGPPQEPAGSGRGHGPGG